MAHNDSPILQDEAVLAAAEAISHLFGLGDDFVTSNQWPVDDGDAVLAASLTGDVNGTLLLAVNKEVASRLASDQSRLANGFQLALQALLQVAVGIDATVGEVGLTELAPDVIVEIHDGEKMCALFGVHEEAPAVAEPTADDPAAADGSAGTTGMPGPAVDFQPSTFTAVGSAPSFGIGPLSLLQDVEMEVTVELGRTTMPIRELLGLQPGMVVELDRVAGAPIDVLVNGRHIALGEVVVIDEEFGIRITEIVDTGAAV